jgi:hypothetical protein
MQVGEKATILVEGPETEQQTVSVDVLVRLLGGFQQVALLFGSYEENYPLQQRFKPTEELRRRYRLRCLPAQPGSYAVPVELVDESTMALLPREHIMRKVFDFVAATSGGDADRVRSILPDSRYRDRVLRTLKEFAPKKGERWNARFAMSPSDNVSLDGQLTRNIERILATGREEDVVLTVIGELISVQFEEYRITIRYPVTKRELQCTYLPEVEMDLLEKRRGLIQLTGKFTLDDRGYPIRLTEVSDIEPVDLSPLEFESVECDGDVLRADPPLRFQPRLDDETQQLYVADDASLDLHAFATTREDLADEITQHIFFAWETYVGAAPERLTQAARRLQQEYSSRFRLVSNAQA